MNFLKKCARFKNFAEWSPTRWTKNFPVVTCVWIFAKHANVRKWPFFTKFSALCRLQLVKKCQEMWKNRVFALWTLTIQNIPRLSKTYILGPILSPKRSVSGISTFSHATCATAKGPEGHFSHGRKNWPKKSELISKNQLPGDRLACTQKQLRGHPRTLVRRKTIPQIPPPMISCGAGAWKPSKDPFFEHFFRNFETIWEPFFDQFWGHKTVRNHQIRWFSRILTGVCMIFDDLPWLLTGREGHFSYGGQNWPKNSELFSKN